jgi:hypothetical protein
VEPADLPSWAEQQAAALLACLGDRWTHVQAVATQAHQVSAVLAPEDRPYLVAAAWLHDVGYAPRLNRLGFHPGAGARYVRQQGQERLASLVAYHSGARFEAEERGLVEELAEFEPEDRPLLDALTYADMTTGPAGSASTSRSASPRSWSATRPMTRCTEPSAAPIRCCGRRSTAPVHGWPPQRAKVVGSTPPRAPHHRRSEAM